MTPQRYFDLIMAFCCGICPQDFCTEQIAHSTTWWRTGKGKAFCITGPKRAKNVSFGCFFVEKAVEQIVESPVIWGTVALMWRYRNDYNGGSHIS